MDKNNNVGKNHTNTCNAKHNKVHNGANTSIRDQGEEKNVILNTMYSMYIDKTVTYKNLLEYTKGKLTKLAQHQGLCSRAFNYFVSVSVTKSIQAAIVILIMRKIGYTNVSQIQNDDIKFAVEDLLSEDDIKLAEEDLLMDEAIELATKNPNAIKEDCKINSAQMPGGQEDGYKKQIAAIIEGKPENWRQILSDGIEFLQTQFPKLNNITTQVKFANKYVNLQLDLDSIPKEYPDLMVKKISDISIGYAHGNTLLIIHQLVQTGVLKIQNDKIYNNLKNILLDSMKSAYEAPYVKILPEIFKNAFIYNPQSAVKVTFLGGVLNGSVGNDFFTLFFLQYLTNSGVDYQIIWAEPDGEAVRQFLSNSYKFINSNNAKIRCNAETGGLVRIRSSQANCIKTLNEHPELRKCYSDLMNNYLSHLCVYEFSKQANLLRGYAPVDQNILKKIALAAGVKDPDRYTTYYKVEEINNWFRGYVLKDITKFGECYPLYIPDDLHATNNLSLTDNSTFLLYSIINSIKYPLHAATYFYDVNPNNLLVNSYDAWMHSFKLPSDVATVEHGYNFNEEVNNGGGKVVSLYGNFGNCDNDGVLLGLKGDRKVGIVYQTT